MSEPLWMCAECGWAIFSDQALDDVGDEGECPECGADYDENDEQDSVNN
jgi:DNA-directed RNA polymerase subunit RPC12/RpoP